MICPKCLTGKIKITHTHTPGPGVKVQNGRCQQCKIIVTITCLVEHIMPLRGQGAAAVARNWSQTERLSQIGDTEDSSTTRSS